MDASANPPSAAAATFLVEHVGDVVELWRELVRWDPAVPTGTTPAVATAVVTAVARALARPQPLGWGTDPEIEKVIDVFATASGPVEVAIGHLVCLREALRRVLSGFEAAAAEEGEGPHEDPAQAADREAAVNMIVDRAIAHAASVATARLRDGSLADEHTGLPNRRSLERDLTREISRSERHGRGLTVAVFQLRDVGLAEEEEEGAAEVRRLQELARAVLAAIRADDSAYASARGVTVMLPETAEDVVPPLAARIERIAGRRLRCGWAMYPLDGTTAEALLAAADEKCEAAG